MCPGGSQTFTLRSILHSFPTCPFIWHQEEPTDFCTLCPHTLLLCDKASAVLDRGGAFAWRPRPQRGAFLLGPVPVQPPGRAIPVHFLEKMKSQITPNKIENAHPQCPPTSPVHGGHWFSGPSNVLESASKETPRREEVKLKQLGRPFGESWLCHLVRRI